MCTPITRAPDGNDQRCSFSANVNLYAYATEYAVERCCDYLTVGTTEYRGSAAATGRSTLSDGPFNVYLQAGSSVNWFSDYSVSDGGFTLCGSTTAMPYPAPAAPPPPPPPFPPFPAGAMFAIVSGGEDCMLTQGGQCVSDGAGVYSSNERTQSARAPPWPARAAHQPRCMSV